MAAISFTLLERNMKRVFLHFIKLLVKLNFDLKMRFTNFENSKSGKKNLWSECEDGIATSRWA
jgi:hypothetical protein